MLKFFLWKKIPDDIFSLEKKFLLTFFLWKKVPVEKFSLEKSSFWKHYFGKKFLLKLSLWIKVPVEISSSHSLFTRNLYIWLLFWKTKIGNIFLISIIFWEKVLHFKKILERSSYFKNFFGKYFIGKKYSWKQFQLEIFSEFWRTFPLVKIALEKISTGNNFCWEKIPLEKNSCFYKSLDKNVLVKISVGNKFLRNYFFGKNYLGKIPLEITHWKFLQCAKCQS